MAGAKREKGLGAALFCVERRASVQQYCLISFIKNTGSQWKWEITNLEIIPVESPLRDKKDIIRLAPFCFCFNRTARINWLKINLTLM